MKANELMIADWVQIANAGNAQVVMVDQYQVQSTLFERPLIDERKLEGIPITETTLDENYDWNVEGFWFYRNELPFTWIRIYNDFNAGDFGPLWRVIIDAHCDHLCRHLKYAHELQHALRLMGLNDLADNFKVV